jgi:hypothetical protein
LAGKIDTVPGRRGLPCVFPVPAAQEDDVVLGGEEVELAEVEDESSTRLPTRRGSSE